MFKSQFDYNYTLFNMQSMQQSTHTPTPLAQETVRATLTECNLTYESYEYNTVWYDSAEGYYCLMEYENAFFEKIDKAICDDLLVQQLAFRNGIIEEDDLLDCIEKINDGLIFGDDFNVAILQTLLRETIDEIFPFEKLRTIDIDKFEALVGNVSSMPHIEIDIANLASNTNKKQFIKQKKSRSRQKKKKLVIPEIERVAVGPAQIEKYAREGVSSIHTTDEILKQLKSKEVVLNVGDIHYWVAQNSLNKDPLPGKLLQCTEHLRAFTETPVAENMDEAWKYSLDDHYKRNTHHPEHWEGSMDKFAVIEAMFDLWSCAMRNTTSYVEAYNIFATWLYERTPKGMVKREKFKNMNDEHILAFYKIIYEKGITTFETDAYRRIQSKRSKPLSPKAKVTNWLTLYNSRDYSMVKDQLWLIPEARNYIAEIKLHCRAVNTFMNKIGRKIKHDTDKFFLSRIVSYTHKWYISDKMPTPTMLSLSKYTVDPIVNRLTDTFINTIDKKCDKLPQVFDVALSQAKDMMDEVKGMVSYWKGKVNAVSTTIFSALGVQDPVTNVGLLTELIKYWIIAVNTTSTLVHSTCIAAALKALGLFDRALDVIKKYFQDSISVDSNTPEPTSCISNMYGALIEWFKNIDLTDWNTLVTPLAIICAMLFGTFLSSTTLKEYAQQCVQYSRTWHFVGSGILGVQRTYAALVGLFYFCGTWVSEKVCNIIPKTKTEEEELRRNTKDVAELESKINVLYNDTSVVQIAGSTVMQDEVMKMYAEWVRLKQLATRGKLPNILGSTLNSLRTPMTSLKNAALRARSVQDFRIVPFHLQLYGAPGVGKSHFIKTLVDKITSKYYKGKNTGMYARGNTDHWDGYTGQPIVLMDDNLACNDYKQVTEILPLVSNVPVVLPMAHLENKGQPFTSEFIISTTNNPMAIVSGVYKMEAIYRRRHILVELVCDPAVLDEKKVFNKNKFNAKYGNKFDSYPHITFNMKNPLTNTDLEEGEHLKKPLTNLTYAVFIDKFLEYADHVRMNDSSMAQSTYEKRADVLMRDYIMINEQLASCDSTGLPSLWLENFAYSTVLPSTKRPERQKPEEMAMPSAPEDIKQKLFNELQSQEQECDRKLKELLRSCQGTYTYQAFCDIIQNIGVCYYSIYRGRTDDTELINIIKGMEKVACVGCADLKTSISKVFSEYQPETPYSAHIRDLLIGIMFVNKAMEWAPINYANPAYTSVMALFSPKTTSNDSYFLHHTEGMQLSDKGRDVFDILTSLSDTTRELASKEALVFSVNYNLFCSKLLTHMSSLGHDLVLPNKNHDYTTWDSIFVRRLCNTLKDMYALEMYKMPLEGSTNLWDHILRFAEKYSLIKLYDNEYSRPNIFRSTCYLYTREKPWNLNRTIVPIESTPIIGGNILLHTNDAETPADYYFKTPVTGKMINEIKIGDQIFSWNFMSMLMKGINEGKVVWTLKFPEPTVEVDRMRTMTLSYSSNILIASEEWFRTSLTRFNQLNDNQKLHTFDIFQKKFKYWSVYYNYLKPALEKSKTIYVRLWETLKGTFKWIFNTMASVLKTGFVAIIQFIVILGLIKAFSVLLFPKPESTSAPAISARYTPIHTTAPVVAGTEIASNVAKSVIPVTVDNHQMNGVKLKNKMLLVPYHAFNLKSRNYQLTLHMTPEIRYTYFITPDNILRVGQSDVAIVHSQNFPCFPDITKHFVSESDLRTEVPELVTVMYHKDGQIHTATTRQTGLHTKKDYPAASTPITYYDVVGFDAFLPVGSSGGILCAKTKHNARYILGLQSHRMDNQSFASLITREKLDRAINSLSGVYSDNRNSEPEVIQNTGPTATMQVIEPHVQIAGVVPKEKFIYLGDKTSIQKTVLFDSFPLEKVPAILTPTDSRTPYDPARKSLNKHGRNSTVELPQHLLDMAVKQRVDLYRQQLGFVPNIISAQRAIEGYVTPNGVNVEHMNVNTSPGIPYVYTREQNGKKDLFSIDQYGKAVVDPTFYDDVAQTTELLAEGKIPPFVMMEVMKDELRPIEKAYGLTSEEVELWKQGLYPPMYWRVDRTVNTRTITVLNAVLCVIYRQYCSEFTASLRKFANGLNEFCIGINPESAAAFRAYNRSKILHHSGMDLDVKNWDGSVTPQLVDSVLTLINKMYRQNPDKPTIEEKRAERVRRTLFDSCMFGYVLYREIYILKMLGMSSGDPGTSDKNTLCHILMRDVFFFILMERAGLEQYMHILYKRDFTHELIYNDDVYSVISPFILPYYNGQEIAKLYSYYGWEITTGKKDAEEFGLIPLEELVFLKRKFVLSDDDPFYVKWAMDKGTIVSLLQYMRKSPNPTQQFVTNIETALEMAADHGEEYYLTLVGTIQSGLRSGGFKYNVIMDYDYVSRLKKSRYFGDSPPRLGANFL